MCSFIFSERGSGKIGIVSECEFPSLSKRKEVHGEKIELANEQTRCRKFSASGNLDDTAIAGIALESTTPSRSVLFDAVSLERFRLDAKLDTLEYKRQVSLLVAGVVIGFSGVDELVDIGEPNLAELEFCDIAKDHSSQAGIGNEHLFYFDKANVPLCE